LKARRWRAFKKPIFIIRIAANNLSKLVKVLGRVK
jgi:hypothetical protein